MIELVIDSRLLEYPDAALWQHQQEMFEAIAASKKSVEEDAHALGIFLLINGDGSARCPGPVQRTVRPWPRHVTVAI